MCLCSLIVRIDSIDRGMNVKGRQYSDDVSQWFCKFLETTDLSLVYFDEDFEPQQVKNIEPEFPNDAKDTDVAAYHDMGAYHLASQESIDDLNKRLPNPIQIYNFRPNIIVRGVESPYGEVRVRQWTTGRRTVWHVLGLLARNTDWWQGEIALVSIDSEVGWMTTFSWLTEYSSDAYCRRSINKQVYVMLVKNLGKHCKSNATHQFFFQERRASPLRFRYRRKPDLYGDKAQFGIYLAQDADGIIRVGDHIRVLRDDKNFWSNLPRSSVSSGENKTRRKCLG